MPTTPPADKTPSPHFIKVRITDTLPAGYKHRATFSINFRSLTQLVLWNGAAAVVFVLAGWGLITFALYLRPELGEGVLTFATQPGIVFITHIMALVFTVALHEMVHGALFWMYTGKPPVFGIHLTHAYAAAPGWYLPRGQFWIVTLAPLVFVTLLGFALLGVVAPLLSLPLIFAMCTNIAGSVGDVGVAVWLMKQPRRCLVEDVGERIKVYAE
jgi:hypothetical protein